MFDLNEIKNKLEYYKTDIYGNTRNQQRTDEDYYRDTFEIPWVKPPMLPSRTGAGAELIDIPVAQMTATVLKAFRQPAKDTDGARKSAVKVSQLINKWIAQIMKQNPNPKLESFKNQLLRGEMWMQVIHNADFLKNRKGLPVHFLPREPMVVFASPNEDENGVPEDFFILFERMPYVISSMYPDWTQQSDKKTVTWMEYWSKDYRYFEADNIPVLKDTHNPYGFVPMVHKIASFGKSSDDGRMENLVVGRLRKYRDLLTRDASSTSDIDSIIHMFANKDIDVQPTDPGTEIPKNFRESYVRGYGNIHEIPYGLKVTPSVEQPPNRELLEWKYKIDSDLGRKVPSALMGMPQGASGRLQDMTYTAALGAYSVEMANFENAMETAFGMGLQIINEWSNDDLVPDGITKEDINKNYGIEIELKVEDPVERDRKVMAGRTMVSGGLRSLKTFLIEDVGMTQEEADEEIDNILAERYMFQSPDIAELMQLRAAEKSGMMEDLQAVKSRRQELEKKISQFPLGSQIGSMGGEPRSGNIQTQTGQEFSDVAMTQGGIRSTRSF